MAARPSETWFVRSNGGSGSYPVTPEGWRVVRRFVSGMFGWGAAAIALAILGIMMGPAWLTWAAPILFAAGAALSGWAFISTARRHTDYSTTYNEFVKDNKNA